MTQNYTCIPQFTTAMPLEGFQNALPLKWIQQKWITFITASRRTYFQAGSDLQTGEIQCCLSLHSSCSQQHILLGSLKKYQWPKQKLDTTEYYMAFTVTSVEILTRRNKLRAPCVEDWKIYGKSIKTMFQNVMDKVGCRAPYQHSSKPLPFCQTKEKMKEMFKLLHEDPTKAYTPACDTLENLQ